VLTAQGAEGQTTHTPNPAMGPEADVERYKRVFGVGEQERVEVVV